MFPSESYPAVRARRLRGIGRRASKELAEAFSRGELSLRRAEMLSRLSAARQRQVLAAEQLKEEGQRLAALVIGDVLTRGPGHIDLRQIAQQITEGIRCTSLGEDINL